MQESLKLIYICQFSDDKPSVSLLGDWNKPVRYLLHHVAITESSMFTALSVLTTFGSRTRTEQKARDGSPPASMRESNTVTLCLFRSISSYFLTFAGEFSRNPNGALALGGRIGLFVVPSFSTSRPKHLPRENPGPISSPRTCRNAYTILSVVHIRAVALASQAKQSLHVDFNAALRLMTSF